MKKIDLEGIDNGTFPLSKCYEPSFLTALALSLRYTNYYLELYLSSLILSLSFG